jgi:hypothetical protein
METQPAAPSFTNSLADIKGSIGNTMDSFSSKDAVNASGDFLQSNSLIAKFVFIILVLIAFMLLLNLGIMILGYFLQPSKNPYLIDGMISGNGNIHITQDPKSDSSIPIFRSNNQSKGLEFTWSVWLYIDDLKTPRDSWKQNAAKTAWEIEPGANKPSTYMHVFNKGNGSYGNDGIATVNNGPGLYIDNKDNTLHVIMDTVDQADVNRVLDISNIPLKKWVNIAMRVQNKILDVYVNGTLSSRLNFINVPKQNYNDVYVCNNGGFPGNLSNLRYHDYAMSVFEINNMVLSGPNTKTSKLASNVTAATGNYSYLAGSWYSSKQS